MCIEYSCIQFAKIRLFMHFKGKMLSNEWAQKNFKEKRGNKNNKSGEINEKRG